MSHALAVLVILGVSGIAAVVFGAVVIRRQDRRHAQFLSERDGR